MVNLLVVDDHRFVCEAFSVLLKNTGLAKRIYTATSVQEGRKIIVTNHIDVAFIDARIPEICGITFASEILSKHPTIKVIGITSFDEDDTISEMLKIGINGILLKRNTDTQEIECCLKEVLDGRNYFTSEVSSKLLRNEYNFRDSGIHFTKRESEILSLLCKGLSTKKIAESLKLKENTVEDYRKEMLHKTQTKNTVELIALSLRNGIL